MTQAPKSSTDSFTSPTKSSTTPSLAEKLGLRYHAYIISVLVYTLVYEYTHSMQIVLFWILVYPQLGKLLPKDKIQSQPYNKQINRSVIHMFAPVGLCLSQFFCLWYTWINYDQINHSYQSLISCNIALVFTIGTSIDACHELLHRPQPWLRYISYLSLIPYQFTTYPIEHLYTHHKHVGSLRDPITAPKNMSLYYYYVRAILASYKENFNYSKLIFVGCVLSHVAYVWGIYQLALYENGGDFDKAFNKVSFFVIFAYASLLLMESIEYLEHYGLVYRKQGDGTPVQNICSWNTSENMLYNWTILRFQRHSDHHTNAYKIYSTLDLNDTMPQLPFSFAEASLMTFVPPVWYKVMNPIVDCVMGNTKNPKIDEEVVQKAKYWLDITELVVFGILLLNCLPTQLIALEHLIS